MTLTTLNFFFKFELNIHDYVPLVQIFISIRSVGAVPQIGELLFL